MKLLLTTIFSLTAALTLHAAEKPNILFIFADDHAFDAINALGENAPQTPHLDKLIAQGTSFTNAYNMGGYHGAVCVASRTMMLTGRTLWNARAVDSKTAAKELVTQGHTWPQLLKNVGYETYVSGKWHVAIDAEKAFDTARHIRPGMPNQTPAGYKRPLGDASDTWDPVDPKFEGFWKGGKHWSEVLADDGVDYLAKAKKSDAPFFMYLAFNAPHDPRQAPQEFVDLYPTNTIHTPKNFLPEYPHMAAMGMYPTKKNGASLLRDENLAPLPRTRYAVQVNIREYFAIITHMDQQIGRILKALDDTGKRDNTLIIFSADHGLGVGRHGLLGKQNMYEHSMKAPLIFVGGGFPAGKKCSDFVYVQDIMATTLEAAEVTKPDYVEYRNILPVAKGQAKGRKAIYGNYVDFQRMVRVGDYKLILYPLTQTVRLFNLNSDPHEMYDLADAEKSAPIIKRLFKQLQQQQKQHNDHLDLTGTYPDLAS